MAAKPSLNPAADNAHGDELSPLGLRPDHIPASDPAGDAAWVAAQALSQSDESRTGVPYNEMSHGGQPGEQTKADYDEVAHTGQG